MLPGEAIKDPLPGLVFPAVFDDRDWLRAQELQRHPARRSEDFEPGHGESQPKLFADQKQSACALEDRERFGGQPTPE